jgi:hypothetical protein
LVTGIMGSNPARSMDVLSLCVCAVVSCAGRGLCDGLIIPTKESYQLSTGLRNIQREAAQVLTRTVEPLKKKKKMMMMMISVLLMWKSASRGQRNFSVKFSPETVIEILITIIYGVHARGLPPFQTFYQHVATASSPEYESNKRRVHPPVTRTAHVSRDNHKRL